MAQMPIEVVTIGDIPIDQFESAISLANSIQTEFHYLQFKKDISQSFKSLAYRQSTSKDLMDSIETMRAEMGGYHPFIVAVVDAKLVGEKYSNLFGSHRAEHGVAIFTTDGVETIIPPEKLAAYILYYFARYTLSFAVPEHKNHEETKDCVFDRKVFKPDILKSMKARAICDECRSQLLTAKTKLSPAQLDALDKLFEFSGKLLDGSFSASSAALDPLEETDAFVQLTKIKDQLDINAHGFARKGLWIYLGMILTVWVVLAVLTYRLGWNTMEPWTYFVGGSVTIGSYFYFVVTQRELSPKSIYDQIVESKKQKNYQESGFNILKYEKLLAIKNNAVY